MRLIGTIKDPVAAKRFSAFLTAQGVENQLEMISNTDWGSDQYGNQEVRVWVVDEDKFGKAMEWLETFCEKPNDPLFDRIQTANIGIVPDHPQEELEMRLQPETKQPTNLLTLYFLFACILLFAASIMTAPDRQRIVVPYPYTAIYSSEVTQSFLYDFPQAYDILEKIVNAYGVEGLADPNAMPEEGKLLLQQYQETPYWQGYYDELVLLVKQEPTQPWETRAPLFEKIRQGEVWRVFSPALLHLDIFHLLFNMLWLVVLGRQIEQRLKPFRYLIFILIAGIFSNTAQYLMSGPNFIGFSGILCAMFTFIWMRQRRAAWEGYQLQRSTIILIGLFVIGLFLIQVASFFTEVYSGTAIAPMIANTAHLSGALAGLVMGRMNFFAWKQ